MSDVAIRAVVSGRVQGVGFRAWSRRQATSRDLRGSATNLPDGRVELVAEGDGRALDELIAVLRGGSTPGSVDRVEVTRVEPTGAAGFSVG